MQSKLIALVLVLIVRISAFQSKVEETISLFKDEDLIIYAELEDSTFVSMSLDKQWPDETINSINIGKIKGKIRTIGIYPKSESGDWEYGTTNVYDETGNLVGYRETLSHFNSICSGEPIFRTKIYENLNGKFHLVKKSVISKDGKDLSKKKCENPYSDFKPEVIETPSIFMDQISKKTIVKTRK